MAEITTPQSAPPLFARLFAWHGEWLQNRRLKTLDPHLRRDIGISNLPTARAAARPGWDLGLPGLR